MKAVRVVLVVLVVLALIFYAGGGWYFAGQIEADALAIEPDGEVLKDREKYSYSGDPATAFGVPFQDVEYSTPEGPMDAWFVPGSTDTWAILIHGRAAPRAETLRAMKPFLDAGTPVLSITYRNDPGQPEDPTGYYRYGFTEWEDLDGAVRYAVDNGAARVLLFGISTGGAIAVSFMSQSDLAPKVAGLALDSPNLDFGAAVSQEASNRDLPVIGLPIPESLVGAAKVISELRFGIEFDDLDYVPAAGRLEVPMVVLHGTADETIPILVSRRLVGAAGANLRLVEFKGAAHVESWNADPARYEQEITRFVSTVTG
jgi:alpha-beta hydrolase superfamily lysophospholipase